MCVCVCVGSHFVAVIPGNVLFVLLMYACLLEHGHSGLLLLFYRERRGWVEGGAVTTAYSRIAPFGKPQE